MNGRSRPPELEHAKLRESREGLRCEADTNTELSEIIPVVLVKHSRRNFMFGKERAEDNRC